MLLGLAVVLLPSLLNQTPNSKMAVAGGLLTCYTLGVLFLIVNDPSRTQLAMTIFATVTAVTLVPYVATSLIMTKILEPKIVQSYLESLSIATDDSTSIFKEVDGIDDILAEINEEIEDSSTIMQVDESLFDHIPGEDYDNIDTDARGTLALGISATVIGLSAPFVGFYLWKFPGTMTGLAGSFLCLWLTARMYNTMKDIIEYAPKNIKHEN